MKSPYGLSPHGTKRRRVLSGISKAAAIFLATASASHAVATYGRRAGYDPAYEGMDDGAAWRRSALQRIEKYRKTDINLTVKDSNGILLPNALVKVSLQQHAFGFGGAVKLSRLFDSRYDESLREEYQQRAATSFHKIVAANSFKWKHLETNKAYRTPFLDWSDENEMPVRGHTLVWPGFGRIPPQLERLRHDKPSLRRAIQDHVRSLVTEYKGRLSEWDVLNEPYTDNEFLKILGDEEAVSWFEIVKSADPDAKRYINDYGVLTRVSEQHQDFYFNYIDWLLTQGAPVQGIGFQSHTPARFGPTAPSALLNTLDRFSTFGLEQQITEFDFETIDRDLQARYTADFLIAIFSHPSTTGLINWTPFEYARNAVAKPDAAMFDKDLNIKPNGEVWNALVNDQWLTKVDGHSNEDGEVSLRGFKGKYKIEVIAGGETKTMFRTFNDSHRHSELVLK